MKTKQTILTALFSVVLVCGILFATKQENTYKSQLERDNVEALTEDEFGSIYEIEIYYCDFKVNEQFLGNVGGVGDGNVSIEGAIRCKPNGCYICKEVTCIDLWNSVNGH